MIANSKYTPKLVALINEYLDLVKTLNGTAANYTKLSKEIIKNILAYHVSPELYDAGRVLVSHTIPTALGEDSLGGNPQRLRLGLGLNGFNVNFYSCIIAVNIYATNGVIRGVDSLILPPPPVSKTISILSIEFSTLQLALLKTWLGEKLAEAPYTGGTIFAPLNWAFQKLRTRINAFLISKYREKYLKALLEYYIITNQTLYSDALYKEKSSGSGPDDNSEEEVGEGILKGNFHVDLPTLLKDKSLSIDIARSGGFISIRINGYTSVTVQDSVAKDSVLLDLTSILIPPKTPGGVFVEGELEDDVEELKERLGAFVKGHNTAATSYSPAPLKAHRIAHTLCIFLSSLAPKYRTPNEWPSWSRYRA
ncbi:hypothetical protein ONS96_005484 [Cadophora gregata f. sp. sojae]|nr:hypothetical protein ONS96_005484 [Cadophora gregata f. sp. sojae]